jgi:hypothetical protein
MALNNKASLIPDLFPTGYRRWPQHCLLGQIRLKCDRNHKDIHLVSPSPLMYKYNQEIPREP